jgi:acetyl-CoA carboxylase biotin carboxyl carrier protein
MTPDEIKELKELIEFLKENDIGEFDLERGDLKVRIKFGHPAHGTPASALDMARLGQLLAPGQHAPAVPAQGIHAVAAPSPASATDAQAEEALHIVKSPIVGTFYESSSPGAAAFVKIGDEIESRGHETDERDRIRRSWRSGQASGHQWPAGGIRPAALRLTAPLSMLTVSD